MAFKKLLCPLDFSPGSQHTVRVAARMTREADAELELVHVWQQPSGAFSGEYAIPDDVIQRMVDDEQRRLTTATSEVARLGIQRATSRLLRGVPWDQIVEAARADPAVGLIVMGTHGHSALARVLLGSVVEQVVRHAPCSVLVVREGREDRPYRNVLCPIDFSEDSSHAVDRAAELTAQGGAGITLLHVIEPPTAFTGVFEAGSYLEPLGRQVTHELARWASTLAKRVPVPVNTAIRIGRPGVQTLAVLDGDPTFDLVIIGSHGRTGITRILLGSVAEKVLRHAACPVLVVRSRPA
jgi:nucleotide-binding universal stress UspA family protein